MQGVSWMRLEYTSFRNDVKGKRWSSLWFERVGVCCRPFVKLVAFKPDHSLLITTHTELALHSPHIHDQQNHANIAQWATNCLHPWSVMSIVSNPHQCYAVA